jgi:hypothetical protein
MATVKALVAQLVQHLADRVEVVHEARLGDLELDPRRIALLRLHDVRNALRQVLAVELPRREIDRNLELQAGLAPRNALLRRRAQHPFAERVDEARFLGERDEHLRRHVAVLGVVPAQERLGADDRAIVDPDHRLVVQPQRVVRERGAQRGFERVLAQPVLGQVGVEELVGVATEVLAAVHRDVRVLEQLLGIVRVVGIHGDADGRRDEDVVRLDLERLRDRVEELLRDAAEHRGVVEVLDDDHELVAAEARQEIGLAQRARQRGGDFLQELVADAVARACR